MRVGLRRRPVQRVKRVDLSRRCVGAVNELPPRDTGMRSESPALRADFRPTTLLTTVFVLPRCAKVGTSGISSRTPTALIGSARLGWFQRL